MNLQLSYKSILSHTDKRGYVCRHKHVWARPTEGEGFSDSEKGAKHIYAKEHKLYYCCHFEKTEKVKTEYGGNKKV